MKEKIEEAIVYEDDFFEKSGLRVLIALRKIIRAVGIHSKKLNNEFNVTTPQMICLYAIKKNKRITQTKLAQEVNLGKSTVNGIIDRLLLKNLIIKERDSKDRRKTFLELTEKGKDLTKSAPALLQDQLSNSLKKLPELEQAAIALSLERVVELMNAEQIDASPNLISNNQINSQRENK